KIVDNNNGTFTATTADNSTITLVDDGGAIIQDNGTVVSVDSNGNGTPDVTVESGSDIVSDGSTLQTTLASGEVISTQANSAAVINNNGGNSVTITNTDGSAITVDLTGDGTPDAIITSGMTVADAGSGQVAITDADGDTVTIPANSDVTIGNAAVGTIAVDLDNNATDDVTVPNGATVV
ncbi:hypothetical protein, partial [Cysteiniphilum halobium]|uniref:hypothetical protein n=1 Tax=Cysteiniphilum halobium TaxID=2219059 RepID=UPI0013C2D173